MDYKQKIEFALNSNFNFFVIEGNQDKCIDILENYYINSFAIILFGKELNAEQTRQLITDLSNKPDRDTIYIIKDFDELSEVIQNILLKSLEELKNVKFFALCSKTYGILETILSRAYYIFLRNDEININDNIISTSSLLDNEFNIDNLDFYSNINHDLKKFNKENKYNLELLKLKKRIGANCNKDLCLDLFIYTLLEE